MMYHIHLKERLNWKENRDNNKKASLKDNQCLSPLVGSIGNREIAYTVTKVHLDWAVGRRGHT